MTEGQSDTDPGNRDPLRRVFFDLSRTSQVPTGHLRPSPLAGVKAQTGPTIRMP